MNDAWQNKIGLISGGTSGIGLATAKQLLAAGASVFIVGRSSQRAEQALAELSIYGDRVQFLQADLSRSAECAALGAYLTKKAVQLDFLVNNAGCYQEKRLENITQEDYDYMFTQNIQSVIFLTKAVLPLLKAPGAIVNIASDAGIGGNYGCPLYSAAKGAVVAFTRALAMDLAPHIRVNCVCPGDVDTPLVAKQLAEGGYTKEDMAAVYPLGRIGRPEEIAQVICGILSVANSFMTGAIIPVDGGLTAKG